MEDTTGQGDDQMTMVNDGVVVIMVLEISGIGTLVFEVQGWNSIY